MEHSFSLVLLEERRQHAILSTESQGHVKIHPTKSGHVKIHSKNPDMLMPGKELVRINIKRKNEE